MAGIPARPKTFFRVGPAGPGEAQCFAVRRGQVEEQSLSVPLYTPEFSEFINALRNNPLGVSPLGARVAVNPRVDVSTFPPDTSVGFIPMDAVSDQSTGEYTVTTVPLMEVSKGYTRFLNGDVLWAKITPCMQNGKSCVVTGLPNGVGFGSTEFHVLRPRTDEVSEKFVMEFISQDKLRQFAVYVFTGSAGQQRVPATFLESLPFPTLPIKRQHELVAAMDAARTERKAKLADADALLAGVDDFVLDALGLAPPQSDSRRVVAVNPARLRGQVRLNSEYYHPERTAALRLLDAAPGSIDIARLADVVSFVREQLKAPTEIYLSLAHVQSHTGELTDSTDTASGACFVYQRNDVLFARLRPYLNKVHRAESGGSCSTEFHVLRIADTEGMLPDYLASILRSKVVLAQTVHMATGNTHPRLTNEDVANLAIPVPAPAVQERITAEIARRHQQARRLRAEVEAGWQAARRWFEAQLLGTG